MRPQKSTLFLAVAGVAVFLALVAGLLAIGSPEEARMQRLDKLRANHLRSISTAIDSYFCRHEMLPERLDQLQEPSGSFGLHLIDPETDQPYEYKPLDQDGYELCAEFKTVLDARTDQSNNNPLWYHGTGRHCFKLTVKKQTKK